MCTDINFTEYVAQNWDMSILLKIPPLFRYNPSLALWLSDLLLRNQKEIDFLDQCRIQTLIFTHLATPCTFVTFTCAHMMDRHRRGAAIWRFRLHNYLDSHLGYQRPQQNVTGVADSWL